MEYIDNNVVYNHILTKIDNADLWTMMNVNKNYKKITKKFVDTKAIERINIILDKIVCKDNKPFKQYLQENNATISGGFVLRSILNEDYKTDIDIYLPQTTHNLKIIDKTDTILSKTKKSKYNYDTKIKYISNDYYNFYNPKSRVFTKHNINNLQRICLKSDYTRNCYKDYDLRICQNAYWYDGKDNIQITNYCDVLTKNCKKFAYNNIAFYERLYKYTNRGFSFVKSKLFSYYIDYLQKYAGKNIAYQSCFYRDMCYGVTYTIKPNIVIANCGKTYFETANIIDCIDCFHYSKWQKNRTICIACNNKTKFVKCIKCNKYQPDTLACRYCTNKELEKIGINNRYDIGNDMRLYGTLLREKVLHFSFLEADNISEIIKKKYNLQ